MTESATQQNMLAITRAVMQILDSWRLDSDTMRQVLGLPEKVRSRAFARYREGRESFPNDPKVLQRCEYVLRIADALRTAYPVNPRMSSRWIHQRQKRFGGRTPISMILEDGDTGFAVVLGEVDCTFAWDCTGSKPATAAAK